MAESSTSSINSSVFLHKLKTTRFLVAVSSAMIRAICTAHNETVEKRFQLHDGHNASMMLEAPINTDWPIAPKPPLHIQLLL